MALLASGTLPAKEEVAAYRVLVHVSPLAYLPRLVVALWAYSRQEFSDQPERVLALHVESVVAAKQLYAMEPERAGLLVESLIEYRKQLVLLDRPGEVRAVDEEIALVARAASLM
ncbi:hypothetical protein [Streptomyces sp. NBC_00503]|uniref:hypothetical protein n=1 Tax=Streptomyces sp. NBC_00503 TaxID=2903659 RepID=UPI002E819B19|nr:hypothetical protein [Streptomyces sp. NBC_00503]WUD79397.1 hypothetical protein OG490_01745 [Streptomyces sp. NBC_00503]